MAGGGACSRSVKYLFVLNDPPYGTERSYNALRLARRGGEIGVCGTCLDARGIRAEELVAGSHRGSMEELTAWTAWADKVVSF